MFIPFSVSIFNCEIVKMFEKLFILGSYFVGINIYPAWIISQHTYCHKLLNSLNSHIIVVLQVARLFQDKIVKLFAVLIYPQ